MPEATVGAIRDLWFRTGDRGYLDDDGYLFFVDRIKEAIRRRGENISAYELETALCKHPGVHEVAVIGIPDPHWGETVHAFVIPKPDAEVNAADIIAFCRDRIAGYKCPRTVEVRSEPFPLSGAGKVLKRELRRPFWENGYTDVALIQIGDSTLDRFLAEAAEPLLARLREASPR